MPYFKAIIMETARMSYGLSARNPRTHKTPLKYGQWVIPANTCIVSNSPPLDDPLALLLLTSMSQSP